MQIVDGARLNWKYRNCAVIVAHPDDETLWAGGLILLHPETKWLVLSLCRGSDSERSEKFFRTMAVLGATGRMTDMDDGPDQKPLADDTVRNAILNLAGGNNFDLIVTHGTNGEYTRHRRHEEVAQAVTGLRKDSQLLCGDLWQFCYEDGGGSYLPQPGDNCDLKLLLSEQVWQKKFDIITLVYGFSPDSFEAETVQREEGFTFCNRCS